MTNQSQSHKRALLLSAAASYGAIIVSIVVGLISVPIGLHYFGPVRYGIWLVIGSILAYLRISDFGTGLSTLTLMAQTSNPAHHRVILRRSISLLLCISVVFIITILGASRLFPRWISILGKVPSDLQGEAATAVLAVSILVLFQLPTTVFVSAFSGLQQVYWNRAYGIFSSITALGALVATISLNGSLVTLAIFTGFGGLFVGIVSGIHLFLVHPNVRPRITEKVAGAPSTRLLLGSGIRFLALQIAVLIIWNTDNVVITHYMGPEMVTPYAITFRLFQMGLMIVTSSIIALWPMYGQTSGQNDWEWIQRTLNRSIFSQIIPGGLIWIGGIIFSQVIINLWAGPAAYGGLVVAFTLGGYVYVSSFGGSNYSLINGLNPTNIIVVFGVIEAVLNLGISLTLVGPLGIGGVAFGTFVASLVVNTWFPPLYIRHRTRKRVNLELRPIVTHTFIVLLCVVFALLAVIYSPNGLFRFVGGIFIIVVYLILSWHVIPHSIQDLIKKSVFGFRLVRAFFPIKERM